MIAGKVDAVAPSVDGLLAIKGVIEVAEPEGNEDEDKAARAAVAEAFDKALADLVEMRKREDVARADPDPARGRGRGAGEEGRGRARPQAGGDQGPARRADRRRCSGYLRPFRFRPPDAGGDPDRRPGPTSARSSTVSPPTSPQARELIGKGGPVGRKLDFLAQEFHREVNTCCSKSNDIELTNMGLAMKNVVEQFREQVQNLE